jgi:hypothetical protein
MSGSHSTTLSPPAKPAKPFAVSEARFIRSTVHVVVIA